MENREKLIKETYSKRLKPIEYLNTVDKEWYQVDENFLRFPLTFVYHVIHSGKFKGSRLLDLGSGAVVHNVASASVFFSNIIMSDYVEENCEELKRWLNKQSPLKQLLDIPAELEGYSGNLEAGKQFLENRIRQSVKQVVRCDLLSDNIFMEEVKSEVAPPYDLILSSLCLEAAALDFDSFIQILKRISRILRPGGGLILIGFFEGKIWRVEQNYFHHIEINESDLRKALKESGFGNIEMKKHKLNIDYDNDGLYCLAAEKL